MSGKADNMDDDDEEVGMSGIRRVARRAGLPVDDVRAVFDAMTVLLDEGVKVKVSNFGTFLPTVLEARLVVSPVIKEGSMTTPRRKVIRFKMSARLKDDWRME